MQVSIAPAPDEGRPIRCHACDEKIVATHVKVETDRKTRHLCNAACYVSWRKKDRKEAA
jgi:hypothetical protein